MIYEKSCGAVVYAFHHHKPLVLVEYMALGHVSLPKGHMEEGETEEQTAAREILEETNLKVRIDNVFRHEVSYSPAPGIRKTVVFFLAAAAGLFGTKPQPEEVTALQWMPFEDAVRVMTYGTDKEVLHHAASYVSWKYYHQVWDGGNGPAFPKLLYREHGVDIHSHIIPGVDDGAQSPEEAMELAFLDREEGMDVVFATPHYGIENGYAPDRDRVRQRFEDLQKEIPGDRGECPYVRVLLGTEWYCADTLAHRILKEEAFPMGASGWYLVEFLEWGELIEPAEVMLARLTQLTQAGFRIILAHPERYQAIRRDRDLAKRICGLGVLLQVNAYDFSLNPHPETRDLAQWMAENHLISFLGSDMHGTRIKQSGKPARKPQMKEGVRWLYEHVDQEYADDVVRRNAEKYLGVEKLPVEMNREYVPDNLLQSDPVLL